MAQDAVRVIAGQWRGRKLIAPLGDATRPTADRVREALFSMLASRLGGFEGLRVADVFAGSGALGLEALSRGAAHCVFVERDRDALKAVKANIAALGANAEVREGSALHLPDRAEPLDLVLMDPPYASGDGLESLIALRQRNWIGPETWITLETGAEVEKVDGCAIGARRRFGKAHIALLRLAR